ncbi:MFS transporter [Amycolatopsis orientalis]|uniref:MFS transporter n=1 Tax=Amycolatopsis orientalis TaxID=31958 RepID=UPI001319CB55|nr:MFS transporter [Amycolatopsis orientalis]
MRTIPRAVWVLAGGSLVNRFGGFVLVFLVLWVRHLGYSIPAAGLAASAYAAGKMAAGPLGGELTDRIGGRVTTALSMFASAAAMLCLQAARPLPAIVALAALTGLASELYRPATSALLADAVRPDQRVTAFGVYQLGVNLGMAAGPAVAGILAEQGFGWLFAVDAATSAAWGVLALVLLPARSRPPYGADPALAPPDPARRGPAVRLLLSTLLINVVLFQSEGAFAVWVTGHGHNTATYGGLLSWAAVLTVALQLPLSNRTRHWDPAAVITVTCVSIGLGMGLVGLGGALPTLVLAVTVWTFGELVQWPVAAAYLTDLAPPNQLGRYAGLRSLAYGTALLIAPAFGTALYAWAPAAVWPACTAIGLAAGALVLPDLRRPNRRAGGDFATADIPSASGETHRRGLVAGG